jgi:acetyl esterase/lipase
MSTGHLLDPIVKAAIEAMPALGDLDDALVPKLRAASAYPTVDAEAHGVRRSEVSIPRADGSRQRALLYVPEASATPRPAYLHLHGGGYVIGAPEMGDPMNVDIAARMGAAVLSLDYRLAPEHGAREGLDDAFDGLAWLHAESDALGVDRRRIAIGGESAGGGLAAALALQARDDGRYGICHQHLTYPMLDDRTGAEREADPLVGEFVWTAARNQYGWSAWLKDLPRSAPWVPARAESLEGLPPTWMFTVGLDLFRDENIAYAQRLMAAGVATDLVLYAGACHGFQWATEAWHTRRYVRDHRIALARALGVDGVSGLDP